MMKQKNDVHLVHTFYTKHLDKTGFFLQCICFVLSCLYAKKSGFKINLHTDKQGFEYLNICPYDNIYIDLEDVDLPASKLYAAAKFIVMNNYPIGVIHIDGDVLLKNSNLINLLEFSNYDCIVQSIEAPPIYGAGWDQSASVWDNCEYPQWANRKCSIMYNCGVIGFNNEELKNEYFSTYWDMYNQYLKKGIDKASVPDLVIEQQFLYDLCKNKNYSVKCLIDGSCPSKSANKIGYQHLIGNAKRKEYKQIIKTIKNLDNNIYNKLKKKFYGSFKSCWS